jgi:hypothetical protein
MVEYQTKLARAQRESGGYLQCSSIGWFVIILDSSALV